MMTSEKTMAKDGQSVANQVTRLLEFLSSQEEKLEKLNSMMAVLKSREERAKLVSMEHLDLAWALYLIEENRDSSRRITWRNAEDKKELIFAYLRKAEFDGINIDSTIAIQEIPEYRRVFQYVAYKIGSWKDIVNEYRERKEGSPSIH